jgi:hypothetical protein
MRKLHLKTPTIPPVRVVYGDELGAKKREKDQRESDHESLVRQDVEEMANAQASELRETPQRVVEVNMSDDVEHPVHRSATSAARAALAAASPDAAAAVVSSPADNCVFMRRIAPSPTPAQPSRFARLVGGGSDILIIALWVDDNKIAYSAPHMIEHFVATLEKCGYGFRNLGEWKYSLGMDVKYDRKEGRLSISHSSYLSTFFAVVRQRCSTHLDTGKALRGV